MMILGILLPVFVLVALSFAAQFMTRRSRFGGISASPAAAGEPGPALQVDVLFYVVVALALPLRRADLVMVLLAWVFVLVRLVASGLVPAAGERHQTSASTAAALVLLAMWVYFALRIVTVL
jgi:hypothetical protein